MTQIGRTLIIVIVASLVLVTYSVAAPVFVTGRAMEMGCIGQALSPAGRQVRICGRVTAVDLDSNGLPAFWVNDGSAVPSEGGNIGVKVAFSADVRRGDFVTVTGAASCASTDGATFPVVIPSSPSDVIKVDLDLPYAMLTDFVNIHDWQRTFGTSSFTNDGVDIATLWSCYSEPTGSFSGPVGSCDLTKYPRLQARIRRSPQYTSSISFRIKLTGPGGEYWETATTVATADWNTFTFDMPGGTMPFVVTGATLSVINAPTSYVRSAIDLDFMLLSKSDVPIYADEPVGYYGWLDPLPTDFSALDWSADFRNCWQTLYNAAWSRLQANIPANLASYTSDADYITISREASSIRFNKKNALVDKANIRGYDLSDGCMLSNLVVTDVNGTVYEQRYATDSALTIASTPGHYTLGSNFTPKTVGGTACPAKFNVFYKYFHSSGLIIARYLVASAPPGFKARKVAAENTLGATPRPLEVYNICDHIVGSVETYILASTDSAKVSSGRAEYESGCFSQNTPLFTDLSSARQLVLDQENCIREGQVVSRPGAKSYFSFTTGPNMTRLDRIDLSLNIDADTPPGTTSRYMDVKLYRDQALTQLVGTSSTKVYVGAVRYYTYYSFYFSPALTLSPNTVYYVDPRMSDNNSPAIYYYVGTSKDWYTGGRSYEQGVPVQNRDGVFRIYYETDVPAGDRRTIYAAKGEYATWTDGYLGMQVHPLNWNNSSIAASIESAPFGERYVTAQVDTSGKRYANIVQVNQSPGSEIVLPVGWGFSQAYSLLPWKILRPRPQPCSAGNWISETMYPHQGETHFGPVSKSEIGIAQMTSHGLEMLVAPIDANRPYPDKFVADFRDLCHRYRMPMLFYMDQHGGAVSYDLDGHSLLQSEQQAMMVGFHAVAPQVPEGTLMLSAREHPRVPKWWLGSIYGIMDKLGLDGFYFDDTDLWGCDNTLHGCSPKITVPVEENMTHFQNIRWLVDSFGPGKILVTHSWGRTAGPVTAVSDYNLPGEQIAHLHRRSWSPMEEATSWGSVGMGVQSIIYDGGDGYDFIDPITGATNIKIFEQALRSVVSPWILDFSWVQTNDANNNAQGMAISYTAQEMALIAKYLYPPAQYDTSTATLHHPKDVDYASWASAPSDVDFLVYTRPGDCLAVAVNIPHNQPSATLTLHASANGIPTPRALVFDVLSKSCSLVDVQAGDINIAGVNLTQEPKMFRVLSQSGMPRMVWKDITIRGMAGSYNPPSKTLTMNLDGVPSTTGSLYVACAGLGSPVSVTGGTLTGYAPAGGGCTTISTTLSNDGVATIVVQFR